MHLNIMMTNTKMPIELKSYLKKYIRESDDGDLYSHSFVGHFFVMLGVF